MKTIELLLFPLLIATISGHPVKRADFGGNFNNGDGCIAAKALADSIQSNIDIQRGEQASLAKVRAIVSQPVVDGLSFLAAKQQLLDFVNAGIAIRSNNQLIAPTGNAATAGLAIVQNAQAQELALASSLAGTATDLAIIAQLEQDFAGGVQQNEQNAIDKRQSPTTTTLPSSPTSIPTLVPTPGPGLEDSRYNKIPGSDQTGWIFGAMALSLLLVIGLILILRKKRRENLEKAEKHELRDWEDAYGT